MTRTNRVRFGPFEFAPACGELWLDGRRVRLQRQPSRLLELLVARPGDVVSREEIRLALWGGDTHVDFERSLNFCVAKLRSALRDNAVSPQFVETVPTRGYRFIAPIAAADITDRSATDRTEGTDGEIGPSDRRLWILAGAALGSTCSSGR